MSLTGKKYESFYVTTGGGDNDASASVGKAEELWDLDRAKGMKRYMRHPELAPLVFQLQQMQDELDYLRTEIALNKAKDPIPKPNSTTVTFSDMLLNRGAYSIRLTASRDFGGKTGVVTKSIDLKLI